METTVRTTRDVGPDTVAIDCDAPDEFDALPGQFVRLAAPSGDAGADVESDDGGFYTISSPFVDGTFEITVGVDPDRADFSAWLAEREAGDRLRVEGPYGDVCYDGSGRAVVLAAGPGIGPAIGIGERAHAAGEETAVVFESDGTPPHESRLDALEAAGATVLLVDALDEASVERAVTDTDDERVFVFGFDDFANRASAALDAAGVNPDRVGVENFG